MKPRAYTDETIEVIRKLALEFSDRKIAELTGLPLWKVLHIRHRQGIPARILAVWSDAHYEQLRELYIVEGLSSVECGKRLGVSGGMVRKMASKAGWKRDPVFHIQNLTAANQLAGLRRPPPAPRPKRAPGVRPAKPPKPVTDPLEDAALIADFLARKGVTVLEPGYAAGLTSWEQMLHAARPPNSSLQEQSARFFKKRKAA